MDFLLDIIMISLLTLTIGFCWKLNNKIVELKDSRKDLNDLVKTFDIAIIKTHKSIADLKVMSKQSSVDLQLYVKKASELLEDLSFMNDSAGNLADRLENAISTARSHHEMIKTHNESNKVTVPPSLSRPANINKTTSSSISRSRQELMRAVKKVK